MADIHYGDPNINYEAYTLQQPEGHHHGWAWIIVIVLIILVGIFIFFFRNWEDKNDFGVYSDPIIGTCTGSNVCTDPGIKTVVRECIPHPTTGRGCLVPDGPNQGKQSYEALVRIESCQPHCVASKWKDISPADEPCLAFDIAEDLCVPANTIGLKNITYQCVANDTEGTNQCTSYELERVSGQVTTGQYVLKTFQIGDIVRLNVSCTDFNRPSCGQWSEIIPAPPAFPPTPIDSSFSVTPCTLSETITAESNCVVTNRDDNQWNLLREGYYIFPLSCFFQVDGDNLAVTPGLLSGQSRLCPVLESPACLDQAITSAEVINGTLPTVSEITAGVSTSDEVQTTVCPDSVLTPQRNNPTCYGICRLFLPSFPSLADPLFNPLLSKYFSVRWPGEAYLSLAHIPCHLPNLELLGSCGNGERTTDPTVELFDVETLAISYDITLPNCNRAQLEFSTALILMLGPRDFQGGILSAQILSLAAASLLGWMSTEDGTMVWKQAYDFYQGPGISSFSPEASLYQVEVTAPFVPIPPPGFPDGTLGTMGLSIMGANGQSLTIASTEEEAFTLDEVEIVVYDPALLNLTARADDSIATCNLLYAG